MLLSRGSGANVSQLSAARLHIRCRQYAGRSVQHAERTLTRLGEQLGWQSLVYNPLTHWSFDRAARRNAPLFVSTVKDLIPAARTIIDVGCGGGLYVTEFCREGFDAIGLEYSPRLRRKCYRRGVSVYEFDVSRTTTLPPGAPFDVALSLEVAEHIAPRLSNSFVASFAGLADIVLFTAAHPGQGGTGHINEQPRDYWIEKFEKAGFVFDGALTRMFAARLKARGAFWYLPHNLSIFVRRGLERTL
jgi:SAM-dependent methyltransferase